MGRIYTAGIWKTKAGMEQQFVAAWNEFAEWTQANQEWVARVRPLLESFEPHLMEDVATAGD